MDWTVRSKTDEGSLCRPTFDPSAGAFCSIPSTIVPALDPGISLCSACLGGTDPRVKPAGEAG
ncbi:hypothetical protein GCM10011499_34160 [Pelagibacterium lentulum]|uniref:Uncharacterized protein n=1 Tax=Pelagibacterium lentulum TaxID=2029865 RepID=A0A916RNQ1_9HYPH|nr:hypothetical protein GCM10011499_34160 [Pelagibacterium lentulum]